MSKKRILRAFIICFVLAFLSSGLFTAASFKDTPSASASYIGNPLTGCGQRHASMQHSGYNVFGQRLFTIRLVVQYDYCRDLHCEYIRLVPCYYGTARVSNIVSPKPLMTTTTLGIGWSLHVDNMIGQWRNHIEGGDWGYHSEHDTYLTAHVVQCIGVWFISQCSTKLSFGWKLAVDGSGQYHKNYNWG